MKIGIFCVFVAIAVLVVSSFTIGIDGDNGIIIGGVSLALGFFGLGRISAHRKVKECV